jgi:bifunctional non-homologous end joining protein LigD
VAEDGIIVVAKTSGSKGLQLYAGIGDQKWPAETTNDYAHTVAQELEKQVPALIVSRMAKEVRASRVLIDWSQNNTAKTTVSPYSLRAIDGPTVSTPVTWGEVEAKADGGGEDLLGFTPQDVLDRVDAMGDLFAPLVS